MAYYLISSEQYREVETSLTHGPAWSLDRTKCIVHTLDNHILSNFEMKFRDANECNEWRFSDKEWSNWIEPEEYFGE